MSFLAGQAVLDTLSVAPGPTAAVIAAAIDDTDYASILLDFNGSILGDLSGVDFNAAVFTVDLICRDVVQTDSVGPSATLTPRGGSPASFRIGQLSLAPGGVTLIPDAGFTDAGDQALVQAAFAWSAGVLSFNKQTVADVIMGVTGSLTNWLDAASFYKVDLTWTGGSQTFFEGAAFYFEDPVFTENTETSGNTIGPFAARKFIRDYYASSAKPSWDDSSGGGEAIDTFRHGIIQSHGRNQGGVSGIQPFAVSPLFFGLQAMSDVVLDADDGQPPNLTNPSSYLVTGLTDNQVYHPRGTANVNGGLEQFGERSVMMHRTGIGDAEDSYSPRTYRDAANQSPNINGHAIPWTWELDTSGNPASRLGAIVAGDRICEAINQLSFSLFFNDVLTGTTPLNSEIPLREVGVDEVVTCNHIARSTNDAVGATSSSQFRLSGTF